MGNIRFRTRGVNRLLTALALVIGINSVAAAEWPLIDAVRHQDVDAVLALLADGVDPDSSQPDGATPLHWAVHQSDKVSVTALLAAGANVNATNRLGASPLFIAASSGDAEMIALLVQAGADPDIALAMGETPLMSAARSGTAEGVRVLIGAGADVDAREQSRLQTALMWAAAQGHVQVARELVDAGAELEARSRVRPMLMYVDAANGGAFDQGVMENLGGYSPLLFAARNNRLAMARLLVEGGADPDGEAGNGATPLVVAAHSGHAEVASMLLDLGADPNNMAAGYSALHAAILRGDQATVKSLLQHGANPDARVARATPVQRASEDWVLRTGHVGATPYWLAASFREAAIMQMLVEWGADPLASNLEQVERLRDRESRLNPPPLDERKVTGGFASALHAAVRGDSTRGRFYVQANPDPVGEERRALEAVRVAIAHGVDPAYKDFTGATALHDASSRNLATLVDELAERGVDINVVNGQGRTALDLAIVAERRMASSILAQETPQTVGPSAREVLEQLGALRANEL